MKFEIGEIPKGWIKGDPLTIIQARMNGRGALSLNLCKLPFNFPEKRGISLSELCFYTFYFEEANKVQEWINWWHS